MDNEEIKNFIKKLERLQSSQIFGRTIQTRDTVTSYVKREDLVKVISKYKKIFGVD